LKIVKPRKKNFISTVGHVVSSGFDMGKGTGGGKSLLLEEDDIFGLRMKKFKWYNKKS